MFNYIFNSTLLFVCIVATLFCKQSQQQQQQQEQLVLKTEPLTLDLYHKFSSSPSEHFKLRSTILVKPKSDYRAGQTSILNQVQLSQEDLKLLKQSSDQDDFYSLKASLRPSKKDTTKRDQVFETQTVIRACSLYNSNLDDFITVNLSPTNEFLSVNLFTNDLACSNESPTELSTNKFNTTFLIKSGSLGPSPDTATYIKRIEEERSNKAKEGKEDNRSFFAKYWLYIVPAVIILMVFSGPGEQGR